MAACSVACLAANCPRSLTGAPGSKARQTALTAAEQASPLARRPYDLRHACLSTWLNGGVYPTQVAEWAGAQRGRTAADLRQVRRGPGRARQAPDQRSAAGGLIMDTHPHLRDLENFGTYLAQRPAFRRPRLHTAAHEPERQDHEGFTFPQVTGPHLRFSSVGSVGRLGLEPRTGGL